MLKLINHKSSFIKQLFFIISALLAVFLGILIYSYFNSKTASAAWWNDSWGYRKAINITNGSGEALTSFQVSFTIDTTDTTRFQSTCADIRVTDVAGQLLPYWIGENKPGCNNASTLIWTKVPSIPTSGATIYVYYGNPSAAAYQNGNNVFEFFDDFSGSAIDSSKWSQGTTNSTSGTNFSISSGTLAGGNQNRYIQSTTTFTGNYIAETRVYDTSTPANGFSSVGFWASTSNSFGILDHNGTSYYRNDGSWINFAYDGRSQWTWDKVKVVGTSATYWRTGESSGSATGTATNSGISGEYVRLSARYDSGNYDQNYTASWDWVFVRKAVATEPTTALASEEKSEGPVAYWKFDEGYGVVANSSVWKKAGTTTNLVTNPSFESGTTNWTFNLATGSQVENGVYGTKALRLVYSGSGDNYGRHVISGLGAVGGRTFTWSFWARRTAGSGTLSSALLFRDSAGLQFTTVNPSLTTEWKKFSVTGTVGAGVTATGLELILRTTGNVSEHVEFDAMQVEEVSAITPYCDGSILGNGSHTWSGTAHASTSICDYGNDGDIRGATWTTPDQCISENCLKFDGTDDYIQTSDHNSIDIGQSASATVSLWYYSTDTATDHRTLIAKRLTDTSSNTDYQLLTQNNTLIWGTGTSSDSCAWMSVTEPSRNAWHFIVGVISSTGAQTGTKQIYIDGQLTSSCSYTNKTAANDNPLYIGKYYGAGSYWKGRIDDVKIYNYARSADQIKMDYNSGLSGQGSTKGVSVALGGGSNKWLSDGLTAYWKTEEGSGSTALDSIGNANGTITGATWTNGKFGKALDFNGSGDRFTFTSANALSATSGTVALWFNSDQDQASPAYIFSHPQSGDNSRIYIDFASGGTSIDGRLGDATVIGSYTITHGQWYHVTLTWNGTSAAFYINGANTTTTPTFNGLTSLTTTSIVGCQNTSGTQCFDGKLDEIRIYNRALSPKEVSDLYEWFPGPSGYWDFNEGSGADAYDKSGNNITGTITEAASIAGKVGKALSFDGADDFVNTPHNANQLLTDGFTISAWIRPDSSGESSGRIVDKSTGTSGNDGFYFLVNSSGQTSLAVNAGTARSSASSAIAFGTGAWYHVAVSVDSSATVTHYINGRRSSGGSGATGALSGITTTNALCVGNRSATGTCNTDRTFNGRIDEVKIYNYPLSAKQVVADMNAGHPAVGSPVGSAFGYWKFDEGQGVTANNSGYAGSALNGTLTNMASPATSTSGWTTLGKFDKAPNFDRATDDYVNVPAVSGYKTNEATISVWFKPNEWNNNRVYSIYSTADSAGLNPDSGSHLRGRLNINTSGTIYAAIQSYSSVNCDSVSGNYGLSRGVTSTRTATIGEWTHAVVVMEFSPTYRLRFYLNGTLEGTSTYTDGFYCGNDFNYLWIGRRKGASATNNMLGTIDEFKVYNYALTSDEVKTDYNRGLSMVLGSVSTDSTGSSPSFADSRSYCVPGDTSTCNPPVAQWQFDEGSGDYVYDSSGNNNTGTWSGSSTARYTSGRVGKAGSFNGSDDYVDTADIGAIELSTVTFSFWGKVNSTTKDHDFITKGAHATSQPLIIWFDDVVGGADKGANNTNAISVLTYDGSTQHWVATPTNTINDTDWHYYTIVVDPTNNKIEIWVDGKLVEENTKSWNGIQNTSTAIRFGNPNPANSTVTLNGSMDQARIYDYARTPAQIAWDYNRGKPIRWYKFDECQGSTLYDSSGRENNGTWYGSGDGTQTTPGTCTSSASTAWYNGRNGKYGSSLNFDGTDDYVNIGSSINFVTTFSAAAWIKTSTVGSVYSSYLNTTNFFNMRIGTGGVLQGMVDATSSWPDYAVTGTTVLTDNNWRHIAFTVNGTTLTLYVDGRFENSRSVANVNSFTTTTSNIGQSSLSWSRGWFSGQIDDVRVYNYPLTEAQVKQVMNEGMGIRFGPITGTP